jgi:hypothetical protein
LLAENIGNRSIIQGSVFRAMNRLLNSVFQDAWRTRFTRVPSVRIILSGSTMNNGINTPMRVRIKKPT